MMRYRLSIICWAFAAITLSTLVSTDNDACPNFDLFCYYLQQQCPAITDLRCVSQLPIDNKRITGSLNCATVEDAPDSSLRVMDASRLLELIAYRDPYGRPWCMLTLFYSPSCIFSAKVAVAVHNVAPLFPRLRVVAVNVSSSTKGTEALISQYGIASTPVVALWENGYPRYRLYDDISNADALTDVIALRTDLKPRKLQSKSEPETSGVPPVPGDVQREEETYAEFLQQFDAFKDRNATDWYFVAAVIALICNGAYFAISSTQVRNILAEHFRNFMPRLARDART